MKIVVFKITVRVAPTWEPADAELDEKLGEARIAVRVAKYCLELDRGVVVDVEEVES